MPRIYSYKNFIPAIHPSAFIAPGSQIIGNVTIGKDSSVWFNTVIRGDIQKIVIGEGTNIQDNSVLHVGDREPCMVGSKVTVGHSVTLHGCTIGDGALIGIGAIVLTGAIIGKGAVVAAGSVVVEGMEVPEYTIVMGVPATIKKKIEPSDRKIKTWAEEYIEFGREYKTIEKFKIQNFKS